MQSEPTARSYGHTLLMLRCCADSAQMIIMIDIEKIIKH